MFLGCRMVWLLTCAWVGFVCDWFGFDELCLSLLSATGVVFDNLGIGLGW